MKDCIVLSKKRNSRKIWIEKNGPIPHWVFVLHKCDNKYCINLDHLFLGMQRDNMQDAINKGRFKFPVAPDNNGSKSGTAKLTEEQVRIIRSTKIMGKELAKRFGVHPQTVSDIRRGKYWRGI